MSNKYKAHARAAARARRRGRACERKKPYDTEDEAARACGGDAYRCEFCGKWHGSASLKKLVAKVRRAAGRTTPN